MITAVAFITEFHRGGWFASRRHRVMSIAAAVALDFGLVAPRELQQQISGPGSRPSVRPTSHVPPLF